MEVSVVPSSSGRVVSASAFPSSTIACNRQAACQTKNRWGRFSISCKAGVFAIIFMLVPFALHAQGIVSCSASSATGSTQVPCTLNLGQAAPFNLAIQLASSSSAVSVPSSVNIAKGQQTAGFTANVSWFQSTSQTVTITASAGGVTRSTTLQLTPASRILTVRTSSVSFGSVPLNTAVTQAVQLASTGGAAVSVSAYQASGAGFSVSGPALPLTLNPGQSATLTVKFDPTSAGAVSGALAISSNSSSAATTTVPLSGTGGSGSGTANLTLGSSSISFGNVSLNTPSTQSLTLTSSGSSALTISAASVAGTGFSMAGVSFPVTLNPGQSATLEVQFDPTAAGAATGSIKLTSNASSGSSTTVALSGTGQAAAYAVDLNWQAPSGSTDPNSIAGYNVYRSSGSSSYQLLTSSADASTSYTDSTVASGTTYTYEVTTVDSAGNESAPSNVYTAAIP